MVITVVSVILFVLISIVIFIYLNQYYPQKQVEMMNRQMRFRRNNKSGKEI